jgi:hypothetical protein
MKLREARVLLGLGCAVGCAAAGPRGGGGGAPQVDESRGDAAKILCEAQCRREHRCDGDPEDPCLARCKTLPVRQPPVWSAGWATEVATCIDGSSCEHDADEVCVMSTHHHSGIGDACRKQAASLADQPKCAVLQGLTPEGDAQVNACTSAGKALEECTPPYDWK